MADPNEELRDSLANLNNQVAVLTQALTALTNAAAAPPAPVPAVPAAPAAVTFATTPGTTNQDDLIDYSTRYGAALYEYGAKGLYEKDEEKFDLVNGSPLNIIEDYGRIELTEIHTQSQPFYLAAGAKSQARAAQNNAMWVEMLKHSLTLQAKDRVAPWTLSPPTRPFAM